MRIAIENAVRAWLILAGAATPGIPTPDRAVIVADQDGPRPPLPYLAVRVDAYDLQTVGDEDLTDATPTWRARGQRSSNVSVNAFGATAEAWLERAVFMLRSPAVLAQLAAAGFAIRVNGSLVNVSALLDDRTAIRFLREFFVDYQRDASGAEIEGVVDLGTVEHVDTLHGKPTDRIVTVTEVI